MRKWQTRFVAATLLAMSHSLVMVNRASALTGVAGGKLHFDDNTAFDVADSLVVTTVRTSLAGVFVVVGNEQVKDSRSRRYLSELWLFPSLGGEAASAAVREPKVLLSFSTRSGESQKLIRRIVTGPHAAAVQVSGWESSQTVIFDNAGNRVDLPGAAIAQACACEPSYIEPLTWLALGEERREDEHLVCHVSEEGGLGPLVLLFRLSDRSVTVLSPGAAFGELGDALMRFYYWDY